MKIYYLVLIMMVILSSCQSDWKETKESEPAEFSDNVLTPYRKEKVEKIIRAVPSPIETAIIFQSVGAKYNAEATTPKEKVNKSLLSRQQAINLGLYGADLSYANIFNEHQELLKYVTCSKKMVDALGVNVAFNNDIADRVETNKEDKDSLTFIINELFWSVDTYLKDNGQDNISALIISAGWIEAFYLGVVCLDRENPDARFLQKIAEQKSSFNDLIEMLATYDHHDVFKTQQKLAGLKLLYDKIEKDEEQLDEIKEPNKERILAIANEVIKIRTDFVNE